MAYIYKITNKLNGKIYVGKTLNTIEKRWKEHCSDYLRERCEKRPLYDAMNKYGVESFEISLVEECNENILSEREKYWIEYYSSFKYGYNATIGGDGKPYLDYEAILKLYSELKSVNQVAKIMNCSIDSVSKILKNNNYTTEQLIKNGQLIQAKIVAKINKETDEIIEIFNGTYEAGKSLNKSHQHIQEVCQGKRKTAYGYKWKYI